MAANPWNIATVGMMAIGGLFAFNYLKKKPTGPGLDKVSSTSAPMSPLATSTPSSSKPQNPLPLGGGSGGGSKSASDSGQPISTGNPVADALLNQKTVSPEDAGFANLVLGASYGGDTLQNFGNEILGNDSLGLTNQLTDMQLQPQPLESLPLPSTPWSADPSDQSPLGGTLGANDSTTIDAEAQSGLNSGDVGNYGDGGSGSSDGGSGSSDGTEVDSNAQLDGYGLDGDGYESGWATSDDGVFNDPADW